MPTLSTIPHDPTLDGTERIVIVDGTYMTLDEAASYIGSSSGGTDLGWFDVTAYGATGDGVTDDTVAIQDAIDAAAASSASLGGGVVYFPAGVYIVAGALQDTSRGNAQIIMPIIDSPDEEPMTIELRGAFTPPPNFSVIGASPTPDGQSVIQGTLNAGTGALLGGWGPVGSFNDNTRVNLVLRDLTIRMPSNPVLTAVDASHIATLQADRVIIDVGSYYIQGFTEPTTTTSYGLRMPRNGNGADLRLGTVNVLGFYKGYQFGEHTNGYQVNAWGCKRAYEFIAADHASHFVRMMAVHCEEVLTATGTHYVDIEQLNVEHAASGWWVTDYDVNDSNHYLVGSLRWHVVLAGTGVDETFTVNGAARMDVKRIGKCNGLEQVILSADITLEGKHANKHILHPSADTTARTFTIPSQASTPYRIGTTLTFVNQVSAGVLTIAITSDTMRLAGAGTTGSRTLAANGIATALKVSATEWIISGTGLT